MMDGCFSDKVRARLPSPFQPGNTRVAVWEASHRPGPSPGHSVGGRTAVHPPWAQGCGGSEGRRRPSRQRRPGLPPLGTALLCDEGDTTLCQTPTEVLRRAELCCPGI